MSSTKPKTFLLSLFWSSLGPFPLFKIKIIMLRIHSIPGTKLQCSVCWEDFSLNESVRQLHCDHLFHEACIVPWLELHGTCPVCRKSQEPGSSAAGQQQQQQPIRRPSFSPGGTAVPTESYRSSSSSSSTSAGAATTISAAARSSINSQNNDAAAAAAATGQAATAQESIRNNLFQLLG